MTFTVNKTLSAMLMFFCLIVTVNTAHVVAPRGLTEECLQCICHAKTGCEQGLMCADAMCGMFKITRPFWLDAGKPTLHNKPPANTSLANDASCEIDPDCKNCATDEDCAVRSILQYMSRFVKDCNGDGTVDCRDYMTMHHLGGYNCVGPLPSEYVNLFNQCYSAVTAQIY